MREACNRFWRKLDKRVPVAMLVSLSGIASSILGIYLFHRGLPTIAWGAYLTSMAVFLFGTRRLAIASPQKQVRPPLPIHTMIVLGIVISAGALMRFLWLDTIPYGTWYDEADISLVAQSILRSAEASQSAFIGTRDHALHFFALVAVYFKAFGASTQTLRFVTATFGTATIFLAFLLGRELRGPRFGLVFAFIIATMRWHITFSRFGIYTVTLPFFETLTLWLLFKARRTTKPIDFALAGLAMGMGLNFHMALRMFPAITGAFLIYWTIENIWLGGPSRGGAGRRLVYLGVFFFIAGTLIAYAPVLDYALRNPGIYWGRSAQISIFNLRDEPNLAKAILSNTAKHLLMFFTQGDRNGRHNLPNAPMLDYLTGALLLFGFVVALAKTRSKSDLLFLAVFGLGLSAAIFSMDFEAPQGSRAFGATTAIAYFAALGADVLYAISQRYAVFSAFGRRLVLAVAGAFALAILFLNAHTYFMLQAKDNNVWLEHSGTETLAAREMLAIDPKKTTIYASTFIYGHIVVQFEAPELVGSKRISPPFSLPIHEPGDRPVAIFADTQSMEIVEQAGQIYPHAEVKVYKSPNGSPVLYRILLNPSDIKSVQGVRAEYRLDGGTTLLRQEETISEEWQGDRSLRGKHVEAKWTTALYVSDYSSYQLETIGPQDTSLWLDGKKILSEPGRHVDQLAIGYHQLRMEASGSDETVALKWAHTTATNATLVQLEVISGKWLFLAPPISSKGLLGTYFHGSEFAGPPAFTRFDSNLDMYIHIVPLPRPYSVDWKGQIAIPENGRYEFGLRINGKAKVSIDGQLVVETNHTSEYTAGQVTLTRGMHPISVRFVDSESASRIHLYWQTPDRPSREIVPTSALFPF